MIDQNLAAQYNQEEVAKKKHERPYLYWIILGVVCIIAIIAFSMA